MELKYDIEENLGTVQSGDWTLELNLVSWNGRPAKYDIRKWDDKHEKMGKGITLSKGELIDLFSLSPSILKGLGVEPEPEVKRVEIADTIVGSSDDSMELPFD